MRARSKTFPTMNANLRPCLVFASLAAAASALYAGEPAPAESQAPQARPSDKHSLVHSVAIAGTAPCEARPRRRHWSAAGRRECLPAPRLEGLHAGALLPAAEAMGISRAEPHTPIDRGNGQR